MSLRDQIPEIALHIVPHLRNISFGNIADGVKLFWIPAYSVIGWPKTRAEIPAGFIECAGQTLTDGFEVPDYRGRFPRHPAAGDEPGGTGGSDTVVLTEANLASHDHPVGGSTNAEAAHTHAQVAHSHTVGAQSANHSHQYYANNDAAAGSGRWSISSVPGSAINTTGISAGHTHSVSGGATTTGAGSSHSHGLPANTGNAGSGTAHENKPAYIDVLWIMKLPHGVSVA